MSVIDGIFLRTHAGMGTPIALQGLWRTAGPVNPAQLDRLYDALRAGPLGRRIVRAGVPGARDHWRSNVRAHPLDIAPVPLPGDAILPWADDRGAGLDPRHGPGWRLSTASLTDGGTVVALTCSHVLADARGLVLAVEGALGALEGNDTTSGPGPDHDCYPDGGTGPGSDPESDWVDAGETWATVLTGTVGAARSALRRARAARAAAPAGNTPAGLPAGSVYGASGSLMAGTAIEGSGVVRPRHRIPGRGARGVGRGPEWGSARGVRGVGRGFASGSARGIRGADHALASDSGEPAGTVVPHTQMPVPALVLRCPVQEWDRVAAAQGGTANSLFVWFVANTLWAAGYPERGIVASLPVDTRDEPRIDNDLAMTEIVVAPGDEPGEIRAKSRAAYERRISSPGGLPEEFLHLVPGRVAYLLSRGAGERDILCSNIGTIPAPLHALGPHECTGVAARAIHPGLTYARRPRTRLSGYLCRFRDDYLLTLASLDPARVSDTGELRRLAAATAQRMGLPMMPW